MKTPTAKLYKEHKKLIERIQRDHRVLIGDIARATADLAYYYSLERELREKAASMDFGDPSLSIPPLPEAPLPPIGTLDDPESPVNRLLTFATEQGALTIHQANRLRKQD